MVDPITIAAGVVVGAAALKTKALFDSEETFTKVISRTVSNQLQIDGMANRLITSLAAYESGFGKKAASQYFNYFNMTAGNEWKKAGFPYAHVESADLEYDKSGNIKTIDQEWRIFDSVEHGVQGFWDFIGSRWNGGRYLQVKGHLLNGQLELAADEMYLKGYYTYPPQFYKREWNAILAKVNKYV